MIFPWPDEKQIQAAFCDKTKTWADLKNEFSPTTTLASLKQIHSAEIIEINESNKSHSHEGDGFVTTLADVALTIHTADCIPVLAFEGQVLGACHGGWRGVSLGILEVLISKMKRAGAQPQSIKVALGPAIGPCHFEVGKDVSEKITTGIPKKFMETILRTHSNPQKDYLDLREVARFKLMKAGINNNNISIISDCTYCLPEKYHSYRYQGAQKGLRIESFIVKPLR